MTEVFLTKAGFETRLSAERAGSLAIVVYSTNGRRETIVPDRITWPYFWKGTNPIHVDHVEQFASGDTLVRRKK